MLPPCGITPAALDIGRAAETGELTCGAGEIRRLGRMLQVLSRAGQIVVRASDEAALLAESCANLAGPGGYPLVFVGYPLDAAAMAVRVAARGGDDEGYLGCWSDTDRGRGPTGMAIRNGMPVIVRDIASDPNYELWRVEATRRGFVASVALPLRDGALTLGSLRIFSRDPEAFNDEEIRLLGDLAEDLAYGIASLRNGAARRLAEARAHLLERAVASTGNGVVICGVERPGCPIVYANPAFERITGYDATAVVGQQLALLYDRECEQAAIADLEQAIAERREIQVILRHRRQTGEPCWAELSVAPVHDGEGVRHLVCIINDINERKRFEEHLTHLSTHDSLTGLANRGLLHDRLEQTLLHQERSGRQVALLMVDLDRFKKINGNLGHGAGDRLLLEVARRLQGLVRDGDTVARIGVDDFAVILADVAHEEDVAAVAGKLAAAIGEPFQIGEQEVFPSASIGVSVFPRDGHTAEALLRNSDAALLRAKEQGGRSVHFYDSAMAQRARQRMDLEGRLRRAIERDEFVLHYQPKVCLGTGAITGAEALVRWQSPDEGLVSPADFIPVAEECGLILPIGRRVLELALGQLRDWAKVQAPLVPIAVNLSSRQFRDATLARSVSDALREADVPAGLLELEITESMVMDHPEGALAILNELKEMGILLALDDFGTGYSSLGYLKRFPIDFLKIDRSFVRDLTHDPDDAAIIQAILAMARSLRLKVIAEGVETAEQVDHLMQYRCDAMQGYYFSRPLPAGEFLDFTRGYQRSA